MNILIVNQPGYNRGDESAHKALVRTLVKRLPDIKIKVLSTQSEQAESLRQYAISDDRITYISTPNHYLGSYVLQHLGLIKGWRWLWNFHPYFRIYRDLYEWANVVVCAPGGICMGGFQNWDHLFYLLLAKFYKKQIAYYGRSFGPFSIESKCNRQFKQYSIEMLHYFSFLSIRDHKSELLANELNIPYISTVDTAFLDSPEVEIPYELKSLIGKKPYIVFIPNYLLWHYGYKGKVSHEQIMSFYLKVMDELFTAFPNCNVLMLPQLFYRRDYSHSDVDFFRDLAKLKNDQRIIVSPDCYSSDIQQTVICGAKALLGSRYHSIVFAVNQNVPFVALSYEHKIIGLLETIGKEDYCIDITGSFESIERENATLEQIRKLLPLIKKDDVAQKKAKAIANNCMNAFLSFLVSQQL